MKLEELFENQAILKPIQVNSYSSNSLLPVLFEYKTILKDLRLGAYGAWIDPNLKVHEVSRNNGHVTFIEKLPDFDLDTNLDEEVYRWAFSRGWVRIHIMPRRHAGEQANILHVEGYTDPLKRVLKVIFPDLQEYGEVIVDYWTKESSAPKSVRADVFVSLDPIRKFINESKLFELKTSLKAIENRYGAWWTNTGQLFPVETQGHEKFLQSYQGVDPNYGSKYTWAFEQGWVRIGIGATMKDSEYPYYINLQGTKEAIKKFVKTCFADLANTPTVRIETINIPPEKLPRWRKFIPGESLTFRMPNDRSKLRDVVNESKLFEFKTALKNLSIGAYGGWMDEKNQIHEVENQRHVDFVLQNSDMRTRGEEIILQRNSAYGYAFLKGWVRFVCSWKRNKQEPYPYEIHIEGTRERLKPFLKMIWSDLQHIDLINIDVIEARREEFNDGSARYHQEVVDSDSEYSFDLPKLRQKYLGEEELLEYSNDPVWAQAKLWYNVKTQAAYGFPGQVHHTNYVQKNPEKFGFDLQSFNDYLQKRGEEFIDIYDQDLMLYLMKRGWVRISKEFSGVNIEANTPRNAHAAFIDFLDNTDSFDEESDLLVVSIRTTNSDLDSRDFKIEGEGIRYFAKTGKIPPKKMREEALLEYQTILKTLPLTAYGCWIDSNDKVYQVREYGHDDFIEAYKEKVDPDTDQDPYLWAYNNGWIRVVTSVSPKQKGFIMLEGNKRSIKRVLKKIFKDLEYFNKIDMTVVSEPYDPRNPGVEISFALPGDNTKLKRFIHESTLVEYQLQLLDLPPEMYGGWIEPEGRIHPVDKQGHTEFIKKTKYASKPKSIKTSNPLVDAGEGTDDKAYARAFKDGWVRFASHQGELNIEGKKQYIQRFLKRIFKDLNNQEFKPIILEIYTINIFDRYKEVVLSTIQDVRRFIGS